MKELLSAQSEGFDQLVCSGVGQPVRIHFFMTDFHQRVAQLHGGLEHASAEGGLRVSCVGQAVPLRPGLRAVIEVLIDGQILFLFTAVRASFPAEIWVEWPTKIQREQRRRHPRVEMQGVQLHFRTANVAVTCEGIVENISAGGLSFVTSTPVAQEDQLSLAFGLGSGCYLTDVTALVVRVLPAAGGGCHVGCQFVDIYPDAAERLVGWIHDRLPKRVPGYPIEPE